MAQYDLDHNVIVCCYIYSYDTNRYETNIYTLTPSQANQGGSND